MLKGKKILLAVTGSIAAYKAALVVRLLKKAGAEVKVIATTSATAFITPLTLATLSENPVLTSFEKDSEGTWNNHVALGLWADILLVAPLSANTLAKLANGICDNLLVAAYLSARCPVVVAPAMDLDMFAHPSTQKNLSVLRSYGNEIIEPESGELASGLVGKGRMAEPEHIVAWLQEHFTKKNEEEYWASSLKGKKVLLTIGATRELIDPVRYITNASTGKMGFALAEVFAKAGSEVHAVCGLTSSMPEVGQYKFYPTYSASEMFAQVAALFPEMDIAIFAAAVSDYTIAKPSAEKIKKREGEDELVIRLAKTKDIAAEMGKRKREGQLTVGFALETHNEEANAKNKFNKKQLDLIVLNSLQEKGAGFGHDTNKITIFSETDKTAFSLKSKAEVAQDVAKAIAELIKKAH